jgi:fluoride exporter
LKKYFFIGIGGALGALLRYILKGIEIYQYSGKIPLNTLFINVSGCFILALILTIVRENRDFDLSLKLGISTGFLGAYTTFSTFCRETVMLLKQGYFYSAVSYVIVSIVLSLAAIYSGSLLAKELILKNSKRRNDNLDVEIEGEAE